MAATLSDFAPSVLDNLATNVKLNTSALAGAVQAVRLDWREPELALKELAPVNLVLGSALVYAVHHAQPLARTLALCLHHAASTAAESGSAEPTPIPMAILVQIASRPGFARWQESLLANGLHATIAAVPAKVYAEALRTFPERMHSPAQDFVMVTVVVAGHSNASA